MHIYLSIDYELFLKKPGTNIGTELVHPTERLLEIMDEYDSKIIFFVDAGYLSALNRFKKKSQLLLEDQLNLISQLKNASIKGHEMALHIHPHWEDASYEAGRWKMDLSRFKLADFKEDDAKRIFYQYYHILDTLFPGKIFSHRSGGWCLEPFSRIRQLMHEHGIHIDSTAFVGGYEKSKTHDYDFRGYPKKDHWRFSTHPSLEDPHGFFVEVPATSCTISPWVYWKVLFEKVVNKMTLSSTGESVNKPFLHNVKKMLLPSTEAVSVDGHKSIHLLSTFKKAEKQGKDHFCIIGHPKCFTDLTYSTVRSFLKYTLSNGHSLSTFSDQFHKFNNR